MKKILFFITAIIFITGCGSSSSSLPALTSEVAQTGSVIIFRNLLALEVAKEKTEQIQEIETDSGLKAVEFAYSSIVDCTSLGYTRINSDDVQGTNEDPSIYFYSNLVGSCVEVEFSATRYVGDSGFVILLK